MEKIRFNIISLMLEIIFLVEFIFDEIKNFLEDLFIIFFDSF